EYNDVRAGSLGRVACFSFYPSKNLSAMGDGGMLTTNDAALAEKLRALRVHGAKTRYRHEWVGMNSRLDSIHAAILRVKLKYLDRWTEGRIANARLYQDRLDFYGAQVWPLAPAQYQSRHVFNQFVIRGSRRDELREYLSEQGIGTEIYYPIPLHL